MQNFFKPSIIISFAILIFLSLPFFMLIKEGADSLDINLISELRRNFTDYLQNTALLISITISLAAIIGLSSAWIISYYEFPLKKLFNILLLLPLAIPAYILAIIYGYIAEDHLPYLCKTILNNQCQFKVRNIYGSSVIFALALYPYIYLFSKSYFDKIRTKLIIAKLSGLSNLKIFYKVALPSARPAIITSAILLIMEIIADFGVVSLYGVKTLTVEIYRYWFYLNNYNIAVLLSIALLLIVIFFLVVEKMLQGNKAYECEDNENFELNNQLTGIPLYAAMLFLSFIVLIAFAIPFLEVISWSIAKPYLLFDKNFFRVFNNSLFLALLSSLIIVFVALIVFVTAKLSDNKLQKLMLNFISLGYAVPGSVIAIAVIYALNLLAKQFGLSYEFISSFSIISLIYAYQIRFTTLAFNNFKISWCKIPNELINNSLIYQKNNLTRINQTFIPLMSQSLIIATLLIAIEVIKELPATLIARPFNFDTLATRTYMLASDEMVLESGISALSIIMINLIPIYFLHKFFTIGEKK